jgi:IS4 transposase
MDRGYWDYARLYAIEQARAWFVIRARRRRRYCRLHSHPVDRTTGLRSDQTISLPSFYAARNYPDKLRRVRFHDANAPRALLFLTNHFALPALVVAEFYRRRWQVELFFRWLRQPLRIKAFYGTSGNAVRTPMWVELCVYALVAIVRKQVQSKASLFEILQVLSVSVFEKTPLGQLFSAVPPQSEVGDHQKQLDLSGYTTSST